MIVVIITRHVVCSRWRWMLGRGVRWLVTPVPRFSPRGNWRTAATTRLHLTFFTATTTGRSHHCQNTKYVPLFFIILSPSVNFTSLISRCFGHEKHQFVQVIPFFTGCDQKFVSTPDGPLNGSFYAPTLINSEGEPRQCVYTFLAGPHQRVELIFTSFGLRGKPPE